jgi:hypothetical protein
MILFLLKKKSNYFNLGLQALVPVILHLLLSTSFVLLSTKNDDQKQLLLTINQFIENIFSTSIDKNILHCTIITIINFRINCKRNKIQKEKILCILFICSDKQRIY